MLASLGWRVCARVCVVEVLGSRLDWAWLWGVRKAETSCNEDGCLRAQIGLEPCSACVTDGCANDTEHDGPAYKSSMRAQEIGTFIANSQCMQCEYGVLYSMYCTHHWAQDNHNQTTG